MKLKGPIGTDRLPLLRARGRFQSLQKNGTIVVQKWPRRWKQQSRSQVYNREQWQIAQTLATTALPIDRIAVEALAPGTIYTQRDLMTQAIFGQLYQVIMPEGYYLMPAVHREPSMATPPVQFLLNSLYSTPGGIIFRGPAEWQGLAIGADNQVLTAIAGQPAWRNPLTYQEGDVTPVLTCANPGDLAVVYTAQDGYYVRIGNRVFVDFSISTSSVTYTTATGNLHLAGLPLQTSASAKKNRGSAGVAFGRINPANVIQCSLEAQNSATFALLRVSKIAAGIGNALITDITSGNAVQLRGSIMYTVD